LMPIEQPRKKGGDSWINSNKSGILIRNKTEEEEISQRVYPRKKSRKSYAGSLKSGRAIGRLRKAAECRAAQRASTSRPPGPASPAPGATTHGGHIPYMLDRITNAWLPWCCGWTNAGRATCPSERDYMSGVLTPSCASAAGMPPSAGDSTCT
jgi:hypothetical protein